MKILKALMLACLLTLPAWSDPGAHLQLGQPLPTLEGTDQFGKTHQVQDLAGPEGLVVLVFRSADW